MIVGVLCPSTSEAINFYRANGAYLPMMGRYDDLCIYALHGQSNFPEAFNYLDVLVINNPVPRKPGDPTFLRMIRDAKSRGIKVVLDYDDYFFDVHPYSPSYAHFNIPEVQSMIREIMSEADTISVATAYLEKVYSEALTAAYGTHPPFVVINNAWNDFMMELVQPEPESAKPRVAWRGSMFHKDDIYSVHKAVNAYMDDFRMRIYGSVKEPFLKESYLSVMWQPLQQYFISFCNAKIDYLLVPLINTNFNQSKSNIAWIEAAIAGAVTVAPIYLPEFNQPGVIHYSGEKGFEQVLKGIKEKRYDRMQLIERSRARLEDFRLSKINDLRYEMLRNLVEPEAVEMDAISILKAIK